MSKKLDFNNISMIGRFAYAVMCAEKYALAKYPEKDWRPLFSWMWQGTSDYFDEWYYRFMEILPEYLYEFNSYKDADFEYLSEEDYNYYSEFLKDIDENMETLLVIPTKISDSDIDLPEIKDVAFSSFEEKNGWGEPFDGTKLSIILN